MQAINTKLLGPTDKKGPRIRASVQHFNVVMDCDDDLDFPANCRKAAEALRDKWVGQVIWSVAAPKPGTSLSLPILPFNPQHIQHTQPERY